MAIITTLDNIKSLLLSKDELRDVYELLESCINDKYNKDKFMKNTRIDLNNGIFAILQTYKLKKRKNAFFETHKKYIDFQFTISGAECFIIGDYKNFKVKKEYDEIKDLIIYKSSKKASSIISLQSTLCIFFPTDVHAGGIYSNNLKTSFKQSRVYKVVVKIPKDLINLNF